MALLCSSKWSDQKCCKTECEGLKTSFQTRPMWALQTHVLARYRFLKWWSKFHKFYKTLKIFNEFSWENHGHGGHEHGVRRGFLAVSLHLRRCLQGVASVLRKKIPIFGSWQSMLDHLMVLPHHFRHFKCVIRRQTVEASVSSTSRDEVRESWVCWRGQAHGLSPGKSREQSCGKTHSCFSVNTEHCFDC